MALPQTYDPYFVHLPPDYAASDRNGVNTLFVSGLPDDVKAREIHNLFRRRPGFDSCQLKYTGRGNQVVAFATFVNHPSAIAAMHSLNVCTSSHLPSNQIQLDLSICRDAYIRGRLYGNEVNLRLGSVGNGEFFSAYQQVGCVLAIVGFRVTIFVCRDSCYKNIDKATWREFDIVLWAVDCGLSKLKVLRLILLDTLTIRLALLACLVAIPTNNRIVCHGIRETIAGLTEKVTQ
ncbi:hypothetical protein RJ639_025824, partial [Escallonia herrerae]